MLRLINRNRDFILFNLIVLIVLVSSLFIKISWINRALLFPCIGYTGMLFDKANLYKIKHARLLSNLKGFLMLLIISAAICFVVFANSNLLIKSVVIAILLTILILLYLKSKRKSSNQK